MIKQSSEIIFSFLVKQISFNFFLITFILSVLIFGNRFFLVLNANLNEGLLSSELIPLILMKFVKDAPFIIGLSISLSVVYTFGRLYKSSEMVILSAAGLGSYGIFKKIQPLVIFFVFLTGLISMYFVPQANLIVDSIKENAKARPDYIFLKEGVFQQFKGKENVTIFSPNISSTNNSNDQFLDDIFLFSEDKFQIITARKGVKKIDTTTGDVFLNLSEGKIYENMNLKGISAPKVTDFKNFKLKIFSSSKKSFNLSNNVNTKNFFELLRSYSSKGLSELMYRASVPISVFIMIFISIIFSYHNPRNKWNLGIGYSLLTYIGYYNLIIYANEMNEIVKVVVISNFLLVHLVFVVFMLSILTFRNKF